MISDWEAQTRSKLKKIYDTKSHQVLHFFNILVKNNKEHNLVDINDAQHYKTLARSHSLHQFGSFNFLVLIHYLFLFKYPIESFDRLLKKSFLGLRTHKYFLMIVSPYLFSKLICKTIFYNEEQELFNIALKYNSEEALNIMLEDLRSKSPKQIKQ